MRKEKAPVKIPEYITKKEVKRVCKELKMSDWTAKKEAKVSLKEAKMILALVNRKNMAIEPKEFRTGLEVERRR